MLPKVQAIKRKYQTELLQLKNVVAVGVGLKKVAGKETDYLAVIVGVSQKLPLELLAYEDLVPLTLEDVDTDVVEIGEVKAFAVENERTQRVRPARGGYSIGNNQITAGTFGCVVFRDGEEFILSNAHVLTPNATELEPTSDIIVQPGIYDGGRTLLDQIAVLEDYEVIKPFIDLSQCKVSTGIAKSLNKLASVSKRQSRFTVLANSKAGNLIDAAIARPIEPVSRHVEGLGIPSGIYQAESPLNQAVVKSGRTTAITKGKVTQIDVTVNVRYGEFTMVQFSEQIMIESTEAFSQPGDSGSAIFLDNERLELVGLLFAGNEKGTATFANRIENVLDLLNIRAAE